jgi:hypothetical protein
MAWPEHGPCVAHPAPGIQQLSRLEVLALAKNRLEGLPAGAGQLRALRALELTSNQVQAVSTTGQWL